MLGKIFLLSRVISQVNRPKKYREVLLTFYKGKLNDHDLPTQKEKKQYTPLTSGNNV